MARTIARDSTAGALIRLRTNVQLVDDIDLARLEARYDGPEHEEVQTLIALARELRLIERALRP